MSDVETLFLAQLLDAPSSDCRRSAVPTSAFSPQNGETYRAIVACAHSAPSVTPEAVVAELRERRKLEAAGGEQRIHDLTAQTGMIVLDGARADLVAYASQRILMDAAAPMHTLAKDGQTRDAAETMRTALRTLEMLQGSSETITIKSMDDHLKEWLEEAKRYSNGDTVPIADIGAFREQLGEWSPGFLCLVYGFSQTGKSHVMQYLERKYAEQGLPTIRLSCEDPDRLNAGRLMSEVSGCDAMRMASMLKGDWGKVSRAMSTKDKSRAIRYVVEHPSSVEVCCQTIRKAAQERGVKVAFVDYAQLLQVTSQSKNASQEQALSEATAMLKETAKECNVQMWLSSQVTVRDPKKVNKPSPFDLKGARSIYEKAECAIALWKASDGHRYAEIQKNKSGASAVQARLVAGPAGVIEDLEEWSPPDESRAASSRMYNDA